MNTKLKVLSVLALGFCLVLSAGALRAQDKGILKGKVIDANEKLPLPTVKVSITGTRRQAISGSDGSFFFKDVTAGTYKVTFELSGFLTETRKDVTITAGESIDLEIVMRQGFASEVTVTARRDFSSGARASSSTHSRSQAPSMPTNRTFQSSGSL